MCSIFVYISKQQIVSTYIFDIFIYNSCLLNLCHPWIIYINCNYSLAQLAALGGFILLFGFLAFNGGSQGSISHPGDAAIVARAVTNTIISGCFGGLTVLLICRISGNKIWSFLMTLNGALAGMVWSNRCIMLALAQHPSFSTALPTLAMTSVGTQQYMYIRYIVPLWKYNAVIITATDI